MRVGARQIVAEIEITQVPTDKIELVRVSFFTAKRSCQEVVLCCKTARLGGYCHPPWMAIPGIAGAGE
jgi:hypothetical protein